MGEDLIGYEALAREALRGVVRTALTRAEGTKAMPGSHHFYVTFRTRAPGAVVPDFLLERYPEDITIVLEHQYWDLEVSDRSFSVILRFGGRPCKLVVPFAAVTRFVDPSVPWGIDLSGDAPTDAATAAGDDDSDSDGPSEGEEAATEAPRVVSLDAFRKKDAT